MKRMQYLAEKEGKRNRESVTKYPFFFFFSSPSFIENCKRIIIQRQIIFVITRILFWAFIRNECKKKRPSSTLLYNNFSGYRNRKREKYYNIVEIVRHNGSYFPLLPFHSSNLKVWRLVVDKALERFCIQFLYTSSIYTSSFLSLRNK